MTRGEIKIVVFVVSALLIGALVQWWRDHAARELPPPAAAAPAPGWAKPPYVFKSVKEARAARASGGQGEPAP